MKDCSLTASTVAFSPSPSSARLTNGDGGPGGEFAFSLQSKRPAAECLVGFISAKEHLINCTLLNSRTQQSGRHAGRQTGSLAESGKRNERVAQSSCSAL